MTSVPRIWRSARGTSLIDVMVSTLLLSLVMAAGYSNLAMQLRTDAAQTMTTETMNDMRAALRVMAEQVAMAGFGVPTATTPSAAAKLITATPAQLSFWTKVNATHTYLTAAAATNATSVAVLSAAGLKAGSSIYVTDNTDWYLGTVQSVTGTTLNISPPLTYNFAAGSQMTPVERVTFQLVGSNLQRNGKNFIGNVTGLNFAYDSATLSAIRRITITLSGQTRAVDASTRKKLSFSVTTQVAPANLSL
jgi:hypothetical protein